MATVADLLDVMSLLNNENDYSDGGADEGRAILALTQAQHYMETIAASLPRVFQSTVNVATITNTETSTWPTALLRLDGVWYLDPDTSRPVYKLKRIIETGGHVPTLPFPLDLSLNTGVGAPAAYYANPSSFYWLPLPDSARNVRVYGMLEQSEWTARGGAVNYPNRTFLAMAQFATKLLNIGVDDGPQDLDALAQQVFGPLLRSLRKFDRSEPMPRFYNEMHDT